MDERNALGAELEKVAEQLFAAYGFSNRKTAFETYGESGAKHEIDVYGEKVISRGFFRTRKTIAAAECKFKSNGQKVEKWEVAGFAVVCHDLKYDKAFFITNSEYTPDAEALAKYYHIGTIDGRTLNAECKKHGIDYYARIHHLKINMDGPVPDAARAFVELMDKSGVLGSLSDLLTGKK